MDIGRIGLVGLKFDMVFSKFSDLHDRSIGGSPIQHIKKSASGYITIQTVNGNWHFANLSQVYAPIDSTT